VSATTIAHRYARALLDIGLDRKNFEQLGRELDRVGKLFDLSADLRELFRNPKFGAGVRKRVLAALITPLMVSPTTRSFLFLLIDHNRIGSLDGIVVAYHELADEQAGRLRARVSVPRRLSEPEAARLRTVLRNVTNKEVVLEQVEEPDIIGGVITRIGGRVFDGSVRAQLEALRHLLKQGAAI